MSFLIIHEGASPFVIYSRCEMSSRGNLMWWLTKISSIVEYRIIYRLRIENVDRRVSCLFTILPEAVLEKVCSFVGNSVMEKSMVIQTTMCSQSGCWSSSERFKATGANFWISKVRRLAWKRFCLFLSLPVFEAENFSFVNMMVIYANGTKVVFSVQK